MQEEDSSSQNVKTLSFRENKRGELILELSDGSSFFIPADNPFSPEIFREGYPVSEDLYNRLSAISLRFEIRQKIIRLLSYSENSAFQLRNKLQVKGYPDEIVREVLNELREQGIVDDSRYAEAWVSARIKRKPEGPRVIFFRLLQRGIDSTTAKTVIDEIFDEMTINELLIKTYKFALKRGLGDIYSIKNMMVKKGFSNSSVNDFLEMHDFEDQE